LKDDKNDVICNYRKKMGHVKANFFKILKKNQGQGEANSGVTRNNVASAVANVLLSSVEKYNFDHEIWIDDGLYDDTATFEEI
jgi:hypothetical protein